MDEWGGRGSEARKLRIPLKRFVATFPRRLFAHTHVLREPLILVRTRASISFTNRAWRQWQEELAVEPLLAPSGAPRALEGRREHLEPNPLRKFAPEHP